MKVCYLVTVFCLFTCFVECLSSEKVEMAITGLKNSLSKGMMVESAGWLERSEEWKGFISKGET